MLSLLFTAKPPRKVAIGTLQLDATIRELHEFSNVITENPVEDGSVVSDHVFANQIRLRIEGEITDSPLSLFGSNLGGISERRIEAYERLKELYDKREEITVVTGYNVYNNMVIKDLVLPREVNTGRRLVFTCDLVQIRKVASQTVALQQNNIAESQKDIASSEVNIGKQPTLEVIGEDRVRKESFLSSIFSGVSF